MRPFALLIALAFALLSAGCADPLEQRSTQEVSSQLERGVSGQGQLTDKSPSNKGSEEQPAPDYPPPR